MYVGCCKLGLGSCRRVWTRCLVPSSRVSFGKGLFGFAVKHLEWVVKGLHGGSADSDILVQERSYEVSCLVFCCSTETV